MSKITFRILILFFHYLISIFFLSYLYLINFVSIS